MSYQENMLIAINNQSSSITGLQISQAASTELMADVLNAVYKDSQEQLNLIMTMMAAMNAFYQAMSSSSLSDFFENYWKEHGNGRTVGGNDDVQKGAMIWWIDFNNEYGQQQQKTNGSDGLNNPVYQQKKGKDLHDSDFDKPEDWVFSFTIDGHYYAIDGQQFKDGFQNYLGMAQTEYQSEQSSFTNLEQSDQTTLQDLQSGVQSTAQAGSNLLATGGSMVQALGYTSNLLQSAM